MGNGALETEYDLEMEDFDLLITEGELITSEVVAAAWHKWFGEGAEPEPPTTAMEALQSRVCDPRAAG